MSERLPIMILASGLGYGGAETVIRDLVTALDTTRFQVTVGCVKVLGPVGRQLADDGYDVVCLTAPERQDVAVDYFTFRTLRRIVRARGIRLVHTHTTDGLADAGMCRLTMPWLKVVHTFHFGNYPHVGRSNLRLERIFSRVVSRRIAVGEVQRQQIRKVFGFSERQIGMVWNGVRPAAPATAEVCRSFRERIAAGDRLVIGTIATLIEQKGLRDLVNVAAALGDLRDRICFVVAGDGQLRPELEALIADRGVADMVKLAGWVPDAAATALPAFDIFFQSSLWEAMSIAVLEAMAAGKPVVATRVGENTAVLQDGVTGLLVNARDIEGMAATLRALVNDADRRQRLGAAAAERVARHFTVGHMVRNYEQLYLETVGAAAAAAVPA